MGRNPRYLCVRGRSEHGSVCSAPCTVVAVDSASGINRLPIQGIDPAVVDAVLTELEKREQVVFHAVGDTLSTYRADARLDGALTFGMYALSGQGFERTLRVGQPAVASFSF
mgnify:CR=1 FL=1